MASEKMAVHFSTGAVEHGTPDDFFQQADTEFHFTLDVCAAPGMEKVAAYFSPVQNGLKQKWGGVCWMNPPYGTSLNHHLLQHDMPEQYAEWMRTFIIPEGKKGAGQFDVKAFRKAHPKIFKAYSSSIGQWIEKAYESARVDKALVAALIPSRTDTAWWHKYIWNEKAHRPWPGVEVRFIKGRLKFKGQTAPAPFPTALAIFMPGLSVQQTASQWASAHDQPGIIKQ